MLSIIVPTYKEGKNLEELAKRIFACVPKDSELIVVDDNSQDGTVEIIKNLTSKYNITLIERPDKLGLSSAVLSAFKLAKGDFFCVMDGDLQHPPEVIPKMLERIISGKADFVIGSRLIKGGGSCDWPWHRKFISLIARLPAKFLTDVKDLTSGFFLLKKEVVQGVLLNPIGFKICLEIISKGKYNKVEEYPIIFGERRSGKSKMGQREIFEYLVQLGQLYIYKIKQFHN